MSSTAKRQVIQRLHDMGFSDSDIRAAINECGYNTEACADWIVNRRQEKKPRLMVGMEVWVYSSEDREWCPGNVVSVTKQLLSIIFNGHDFRWLEKDSDLYRVQDEKPQPRHTLDARAIADGDGPATGSMAGDDEMRDDPYSGDLQQHEKAPPRPDELDYHVTFTESVLGLELYSDEDGFNCIVGRCVSTIARQKVTPGSQIVQVNDRWLANYRFEEIRDAVKQAARQPPLAVTFRIKKNLMRRSGRSPQNANNQRHLNTQAINIPNAQSGAPNASPYGVHNAFDVSQSATSPDTQKLGAPKLNNALDEEKRSQPPHHHQHHGQREESDFMGTLPFADCDKLQIGDHIDHRDDVGRFLLATIVDKDAFRVKIHYEGWNSKWDTWCDYKAETHRFANPRSISRKPNTRFRDLKIRDYVDINPVQRHQGWRVGQIRRMDKYSGQSQIVYKEDGQEFLYWAHLNNPEEIAPFMTRAAETIALQQKIAEFEEEHQHRGNAQDNPQNAHSLKPHALHQHQQQQQQQQQPQQTQPPQQVAAEQTPPPPVDVDVNVNPLANGHRLHYNDHNNLHQPLPPQQHQQHQHQQHPQHQPPANGANGDANGMVLISSADPPAPNGQGPPQAAFESANGNGFGGANGAVNGNLNVNGPPNGGTAMSAEQTVNNMAFSGQPQPPSASGLGVQPMGYGNGPPHKINMAAPSGVQMAHPAQHQKTRSRVLPRSLKNKKLPPKPTKSPKKRKQNMNGGAAMNGGYAANNGFAANLMAGGGGGGGGGAVGGGPYGGNNAVNMNLNNGYNAGGNAMNHPLGGAMNGAPNMNFNGAPNGYPPANRPPAPNNGYPAQNGHNIHTPYNSQW